MNSNSCQPCTTTKADHPYSLESKRLFHQQSFSLLLPNTPTDQHRTRAISAKSRYLRQPTLPIFLRCWSNRVSDEPGPFSLARRCDTEKGTATGSLLSGTKSALRDRRQGTSFGLSLLLTIPPTRSKYVQPVNDHPPAHAPNRLTSGRHSSPRLNHDICICHWKADAGMLMLKWLQWWCC